MEVLRQYHGSFLLYIYIIFFTDLSITFIIKIVLFERIYIQIYHVWEGYLRKIPVERRKISRAERRGKFSLKTGIFRKYPSQT